MEQHIGDLSKKTKLTVTPLRGQDAFAKLIQKRPSADWDLCFIHVLLRQKDVLDKVAFENTFLIDSKSSCELGLIVPKKRFPLAVDRNRIRRVCKSQLKMQWPTLATTLVGDSTEPFTLQVLIRFKTPKKTPLKKPSKDVADAAQNFAKGIFVLKNQDLPQTVRFSKMIGETIKTAIYKAIQANSLQAMPKPLELISDRTS